MYLHRITLERFRSFHEQEYTFHPGLNLIRGPNEAGKSSLQSAILCVLFGNPRHMTIQRTKHIDDLVSWHATSPFRIILDFVDNDKGKYRLEKDWARDRACLTEMESGHVMEGIDTVQQRLRAILGFASIKVFQSTACVEQDAITDLSDGQKTINDHLQRLVTSGGDESAASDVIQKLDDRIREMEKGWKTHAPKFPGPIKRHLDELTEIEGDLSECSDYVARLTQAEQDIKGLKDRLAKIEADLETLRAVQRLCDERFEWEQVLQSFSSKETKLEKKIARIKKAQALIAEIDVALKEDFSEFDSLDDDTDQQLREKRQRVLILRENIGEAEDRLARLHSRRNDTGQQPRAVPIYPIVGLGLGVLLMFLGLVVGLSHSTTAGILVGTAGLLAGGGSLVWLFISMKHSGSRPSGMRVEELEQELSDDRRALQCLEEEVSQALDEFQCSTWAAFDDKCSLYRQYVQGRQHEQTRRDTLLDDEKLATLIAKRKEASRRRRDAEERLSEPSMQRATAVSPREYEEMIRDIQRLEEEEQEVKARLLQSEALTSHPAYTVEDVHRLQELRMSITWALERLRERLAVYRLTRNVLEEAKKQTMRSARDELEPRIATHLARLTRGRYARVRADEELNLEVFSPHKDGWVTVDGTELSSGTLEQLYFAARLALIELLYQDVRPPLLLDDPFVKFDAPRRDEALRLCKQIAQVGQVLLFTCHDHYDSAADRIIQLHAPI